MELNLTKVFYHFQLWNLISPRYFTIAVFLSHWAYVPMIIAVFLSHWAYVPMITAVFLHVTELYFAPAATLFNI